MAANAYSAIAGLFETLMGDYDAWAGYIIGKLKAAGVHTGADVGCGSGAFTRRFKKAGFDVFGSDISPEMLSAAAAKAREEGLRIEYTEGDARTFTSLKKLDFITALNDTFNYLDRDGAAHALHRFSRAMKRGGLLVFDVSTEYKIRNVLGFELFGEDRDECTYLWFNTQTDEGVVMDIVLFTKKGELYERRDERHVQYIHTREELEALLFDSGFELLSVEGPLGAPVTEKSERLTFTARKI